jgi:AP-2 complex subunit mu-1
VAWQVTGAVGWRKDNIKYKKNEVFLDIVEQVNVLMSSKGSVLRSDVNGKVVMKVFLSGMPDVRLGLNDKLEVRPARDRALSTGNTSNTTHGN